MTAEPLYDSLLPCSAFFCGLPVHLSQWAVVNQGPAVPAVSFFVMGTALMPS